MQVGEGAQNSTTVVVLVGDHCIVTFSSVDVINGKIYVLIQRVVYVCISICMSKFPFSLFYSIFHDMI